MYRTLYTTETDQTYKLMHVTSMAQACAEPQAVIHDC